MDASNLLTLRALFAKDWHFFRVPMLALLTIGAGSYGIATIVIFFSHSDLAASDAYLGASIWSTMFMPVIAAAFGGVAFADERRERNAAFVGLLPVSRGQIMLSKCLVSVAMMSICFLLHFLVAMAMAIAKFQNAPGERPTLSGLWEIGRIMLPWFACCVCFFGIAWLFSTFMNSGALSACIAIGITTGTVLLVASTTFRSMIIAHPEDEFSFELTYTAIILLIGLCSGFAGTIYYSRRIEP